MEFQIGGARLNVFPYQHVLTKTHAPHCGPGSVIGLATGYGLDDPGIKSRWGGGEIFRTCPGRPWGPTSFPYNAYQVFAGGKERPGRGADHSPTSSDVRNLHLDWAS